MKGSKGSALSGSWASTLSAEQAQCKHKSLRPGCGKHSLTLKENILLESVSR